MWRPRGDFDMKNNNKWEVPTLGLSVIKINLAT